MQCGRVVQLFRRLSTGDSRLNINSHSSVNPVGRAFEIDKTLPRRRITSSSPILGTSIPPAVYVIIRPMASTSDNSSKPASSGKTTKPKHENRLIHEKSPYLQQHANNPVDWYPWGSEAFDKAKAEDKLIFLSVGYSTCHWCHVMEKESFENESVADIMNKHFVNIKVDREERPDIDKIYMTFIQATSGGGGWPMSVFLTPDLSPVFGGTYFPPEDKWGRAGFKTVLNSLATKWSKDRTEFIKTGQQVLEVLRRATTMDISESLDYPVPGQDCWKKCIQQFARNFEPEYGGFSTSPKFPQPVNLNFLFHAYARHKTTEESKQCLEMCLYTLRKMANGGIHDHISSGFARYSVDNKWHVPHFEKMLYDQAQLTYSYCDAYLATKDQFYADIVRDILKYVGRDLSHPLGGFYSAEDADSLPSYEAKHKVEGAFCVWEYSEIQEHLGDKTIVDNVSYADIFCHYFNVLKQGNVNPSQDPHGELKKKNVLIIFNDLEDTSAKYNISIEQAQKAIDESKSILYEVRQKRPRPHLDDKMLCSWNGLMISGYAKAGQVLRDKTFIARAIKAAEFIKEYLYNAEEATLLRSCYRGENDSVTQIPLPIPGFVDDYAFLIRGLLDLYEACLGREWLEWAQQLQTTQNRLFWDPEAFGYFTSPDGDPSVVIRLKEDQDGAEPSGNSVSAHNLLRLAAHLETPACTDRAQQLLAAFKTRLERVPIAIPEMTSALMFYHDSPTQVFIAGAKDDPQTQALLEVVRSRLIPGRILAVSDRSNGGSGGTTILSRIRTLQGRPAAYVCRHYACSMPVTEVEKLAELLDEKP